ncbi:amidohydrolase family protein [Novosphingobium sp.]|uniref:amidohydrolase family protein n=1 Tax=Novosphingobium sp. TaxID=1874826 RepID=UPI002610ECB6|nr:amidohydrolase family protein [Novosphingobium sp.]
MSFDLSRRTTLAAVLGSVALGGTRLAAAPNDHTSPQGSKPITGSGKIDTHQHFLPKVYVDAVGLETLASVMPNRRAPEWSETGALAMMDARGIAKGVISISSGPVIPDAPNVLRKCNDEGAAIGVRHKGRFGLFASLPLPDIDASLKELAYALDTLKAEGVILFTNYGGKYLGDPAFRPLLEELNRRSGVAFLHPNEPNYHLVGQPPESVLEFPFDTTRTAASLIFSGAMKAFPNIRFILSHAGGTLPFLSQRLAGAVMLNPGLEEKIGDPNAAIRQFWFDTALSMSKPAMAALMAVADPTKIVFGTDFPMAPPFAITMSVDGLAAMPIDEASRNAISYNNAERLLSIKA